MFSGLLLAAGLGAAGEWLLAATGLLIIVVAALFILSFATWLTIRYVPNDRAAIVEKLWSANGSVAEGRIIASATIASIASASGTLLILIERAQSKPSRRDFLMFAIFFGLPQYC